MRADSPFTPEQTLFILELLQNFQDANQVSARLQRDLAQHLIALRGVLIDNSLVTEDEFRMRVVEAGDDLKAEEIAEQNKQFFDELRKRLEGSE